jgi:hypothetical protein
MKTRICPVLDFMLYENHPNERIKQCSSEVFPENTLKYCLCLSVIISVFALNVKYWAFFIFGFVQDKLTPR